MKPILRPFKKSSRKLQDNVLNGADAHSNTWFDMMGQVFISTAIN